MWVCHADNPKTGKRLGCDDFETPNRRPVGGSLLGVHHPDTECEAEIVETCPECESTAIMDIGKSYDECEDIAEQEYCEH